MPILDWLKKKGLFLLLLLSSPLAAEEVFYLCAGNVSAWRQVQGELYVQLSAPAMEAFARLTQEAQGERLSVRIDGEEPVSVMVFAPVDSGRIVLNWPYRHRLQHLPEGPCGSP